MKEKELKLEIEELEERIAPSFVFDGGSAPALAGAEPDSPATADSPGTSDATAGDPTFGPSSSGFPSENDSNGNSFAKAAWTSHKNTPSPLGNGGS